MNTSLLSVETLTVRRGGNPALIGLDATLEAGKTLAILGANGAGKSTLLRAIMGFEKPDAGRIQLMGRDLATARPRDRAALGIGYCPEGRRLFPGLTVEETLAVAFKGSFSGRRERVEEVLSTFPALQPKRFERAWSLSGGQQQMLAIARAIINKPRLILLDEPALGLAPMIIAAVLDVVRDITNTGAGVILAEQNIGPALRLADTVLVLVRGAVVYTGPAKALDPARAAELMLAGGGDGDGPGRPGPARD